jgi:hypothetical protein
MMGVVLIIIAAAARLIGTKKLSEAAVA